MSFTDPEQPAPQQPAPQYAPYVAPAPAHAPALSAAFPPASASRPNVLGILALALLVLEMLFGSFTPFLYHAATGNFAAVSAAITIVHALLLLAALGLAIAGVLQRGRDRFRWAAIGSLVASGLALVGIVLNLFSGWLSTFLSS